MVVIVGCGRSGTTALGRALSTSTSVAYLNEPRWLWSAALPQSDVWTTRALRVGGRLVLTAEDIGSRERSRLWALVEHERTRLSSCVVLEKTPVNAFRLGAVFAAFPSSSVIVLRRGGREVARSIARFDQGKWFGHEDFKWNQLAELAIQTDQWPGLDRFPLDDYERGLLEWRLSNDSINRRLMTVSPSRVTEVDYAELVTNPRSTLARLFDFVGVHTTASELRQAAATLGRPSSESPPHASQRDRSIVGETWIARL